MSSSYTSTANAQLSGYKCNPAGDSISIKSCHSGKVIHALNSHLYLNQDNSISLSQNEENSHLMELFPG